jgi:histidinol-phosphatase (PHP family)
MEIFMIITNNLSDFHIHSYFSSDSDARPEDIINTAINAGLKRICFTDHNDYDYPLEDGKVMFLLDFEKYVKEISKLRDEYAKKIDIYIGVEQGLQAYLSERIDNYDNNNVLDFIIGSSHLVHGNDPYHKEYWDNLSVRESILTYFESIVENIKACNNFDVYGHLDYIIRYAPNQDRDYNWLDYYDIIDEILKALINRGKGIEVNTAGLKYGLKEPNPCHNIVKRYKELGGEIITIGSDAHKAEHIAYDFNIMRDYLYNAGFKYYTIFSKRQPQFLSID